MHFRNSKRSAKRVNDAMIGSHIEHSSSSKQSKSLTGSFPSVGQEEAPDYRVGSDAQHGYVSQVGISSSSGENDNAYSRRITQPGYIHQIQSRKRRRNILVIVLIVLIVLVVAIGVGLAVYFTSSDSKLSGGLTNASEALVEAEKDQPYYVLCAAELGDAVSAGGAATDAYMLVRVDEAAHDLTFVNIPSNLSVVLSDGEYHPLYDAVEVGGQAELIEQVASFVGVEISHFAWTDSTRFANLVDALGGVDINVEHEVDDPYASTIVLHEGEQTLDGEQALAYLRATNFREGFEATAQNRVDFTQALMRCALTSIGLSLAALVGEVGDYVSCDFTSAQLLALGDEFHDLDEVDIYSYLVPGSETGDDEVLYKVSDSEWEQMSEAIRSGSDPATLDNSAASVVASEITVEVLNGGDVTGAANNMATILEDAGFVVSRVDNVTDATTYPETLVIYKDPVYENAAKAIVETISAGRVIDGGDYYTLEANVQVIVGQDWIPMA